MLPLELTSRLEKILWWEYAHVMQAFSSERIGSLRINTLKAQEQEVMKEFQEKGIIVTAFPWISGVFIFEKKYEYTLKGTRAFYDGKIYLQGISSMLPVLILNPCPGDTILDVCAAPGSKTTQMATMMNNIWAITALEHNQIRFDKLIYNCRLQGATIVEGKKMDARKYLETFTITPPHHKNEKSAWSLQETPKLFDKILLDAPCSAEGRISLQNEKSYGFWSLKNIAEKSVLQYSLLTAAWQALKPGWVLVYSTCTLAPEENEGVISQFLSDYSDASIESTSISLSEMSWWQEGIQTFGEMEYATSLKKAVRILPSEETEGFFIVKLLKSR